MANHWADQTAQKVIDHAGQKEEYVCASGITPSGTVHFGNFREIITVDLIVRALRDAGKRVRFIYSWDDFDALRKVPKNLPKQDMLKTFLRTPIADVPDPYDKDESYARHQEKRVEDVLPVVGIHPEFIYQNDMYRKGSYEQGMMTALQNTKEVKTILDEFRSEPLPEEWLPISVFDPETNKDTVSNVKWDGKDTITFVNEKENIQSISIAEGKYLKLLWRIDWPMRWKYESVDFEPGGKDHSTQGGSYSTGQIIADKIYGVKAPYYIMYNFINQKGKGGKMSSSVGDVLTLQDVLDIYEPEVVRYLFAGTRPSAEFEISFDLDVVKVYEDFDTCERIFFKQTEVEEAVYEKQKRIYQLSCVEKSPEEFPDLPNFRHITTLVQIYQHDEQKTFGACLQEHMSELTKQRLRNRIRCASNWLKTYAPEDFIFEVQNSVSQQAKEAVTKDLHEAFNELITQLQTDKDAQDIGKSVYEYCKNSGINVKAFYKAAYLILLNKPKGPKLVPFIVEIGKERCIALFNEAMQIQ